MSAINGYKPSSHRLADADLVENDGWWPEVNLKDLQDALRLPGGVTAQRVAFEVRRAIRVVNNDLALWRMKQQAAGYSNLKDVPVPDAFAPDHLIGHYLDAVYSLSEAKLMERYRNTDTTAAGDKRADMLDARIAEALRDKYLAVAAILSHQNPGHSNVTAELL